MTKVAIVPEPAESGALRYRAIAGDRQSIGKTAGEALDTLCAQIPADRRGTLVIVQSQEGDEFFTAQQRKRLQELMAQWRAARDAGSSLSPPALAELNALVEEEVAAAGRRAAALLQELGQ